jgi:hypothetical protein
VHNAAPLAARCVLHVFYSYGARLDSTLDAQRRGGEGMPTWVVCLDLYFACLYAWLCYGMVWYLKEGR